MKIGHFSGFEDVYYQIELVGNTEQQNERLDDVGVFVAFNYYKRVA